jgi:H+-translocating NAD(P) transhydrogenase subunit alpha
MADPFPTAVEQLRQAVDQLGARVDALSSQAQAVAAAQSGAHEGGSFLIMGLTVFVLALFVGYYVVWNVTPALHSPLMAVTNAISSVIIVGALIAAGTSGHVGSSWFGFVAVMLASVNIFGGFIVTQRMLAMFKKRDAKGAGGTK